MGKIKKCPFCAEEIQDEAIVCRYCGRDLPKEPNHSEGGENIKPEEATSQTAVVIETKTKNKVRPFLIVGIVLLVLLLIAGVGAWGYLYSPQYGIYPHQTATMVVVNATATEEAIESFQMTATIEAYCPQASFIDSVDEIQKILTRFDDAEKLANSTGRIALAAPVSQMQAIRQDIANLQVIPCLASPKNYATYAMDATINGFLASMAQKSDKEVTDYFDSETAYIDKFYVAINNLKNCLPNCHQ